MVKVFFFGLEVVGGVRNQGVQELAELVSRLLAVEINLELVDHSEQFLVLIVELGNSDLKILGPCENHFCFFFLLLLLLLFVCDCLVVF